MSNYFVGNKLFVKVLMKIAVNSKGIQKPVYAFLSCTFNSSVKRIEKQLLEIEKKYRLTHRWSSSDKEFEEYRLMLAKHKKRQILSSLWTTVTKRHYLLKLKAKYAGTILL